MRLLYFLSLIMLCCLLSCGKNNEQKVSASNLISPADNEICNVSTIISSDESSVLFKWEPSDLAQSYDVGIKNLLTGKEILLPVNDTQLSTFLAINTPYSWYVIAKSANSSTKSEIRKFYNSGPGPLSYAPYPAETVYPLIGQVVDGTTIKFQWLGEDVDKDIINYDFYLGTSTPVLFKSDITENFHSDVPLAAKTKYYWKIITKDSKGNTSDSGIFYFIVN